MTGAQSLIRNGLAQTDLDMNHFRLLNLDTSNLPPSGIPPTIVCETSNWLNGWDSASLTWSQKRPKFTDIDGPITALQQAGITQVGLIHSGTWRGSVIDAGYLPTLNAIRSPVLQVSLNNQRIINLADPISPQDAVTKAFMDLMLQGLNPKEAVRVASTAQVNLNGLSTIDGIAVHIGDRVLIKNQLSPKLNGIWVASTGTWTRATDADHGSGDVGFTSQNSIDRGAYCVVLLGTQNGGTSWFQKDDVVHVTNDPSGDDIEFVLFSNANELQPGNGLNVVGNTLNVVGTTNRITVGAGVDIASTYVGQNSITTLGTIGTGAWQGDIVAPEFGGTGADNGANTLNLSTNLNLLVGLDFITGDLTFTIHGNTVLDLPTVGTLATLDQVETFTNKRITKRFLSTATSSAPSINTDVTDVYYITALGANITSMTTNLTGTPVDGDELEIWIKDNGVARSITWGAKYTASSDMPLPFVTIPSMWMRTKFWYNTTLAKWVLIELLKNIS